MSQLAVRLFRLVTGTVRPTGPDSGFGTCSYDIASTPLDFSPPVRRVCARALCQRHRRLTGTSEMAQYLGKTR